MAAYKNTWVLKIAALGLALLTYAFIQSELRVKEKERKDLDPSYKLIKLTAQNIPIKARIAGGPAEGYRVLVDEVAVHPDHVVAIGPEALLQEASSCETALVDASEHTKTFTRSVPLESAAGIHLSGKEYFVDVTVPIQSVDSKS